MFIMVNNLPNHDGLLGIVGNQEHIELGRWFLKYACILSSYFTIPWIIGIISISLLGLTSIVIVEIFDIKEKINIVLTSAILVVFPTIASGFAYIFTLDGYMVALLLASLAVLITFKYKYGFLLGAVCLSLSLGCYQAYLSVTMILCILKLMLSIINNKKTREIMLEILKILLMGVLGIILYYVVLNIALKISNTELSTYHMLMRYSWCLFYVFFIVLLEKKFISNILIQWISAISIICVIFNFIIVDNIAYFNAYYKHQKSYSMFKIK